MARIHKIVLTGGPCSGKKTALAILSARLSERGYKVVRVPNALDALVNTFGVRPAEYELRADVRDSERAHDHYFSFLLPYQQLQSELVAEAAAKSFSDVTGQSVVILCDGGIPDMGAYVSRESFEQGYARAVEQAMGDGNAFDPADFARHVALLYDGAIHLVSAAIGAEDSYQCSRTASDVPLEQAAANDRLLMQSWAGHPHLRIVNNQDKTFAEKMEQVVSEVCELIGEPVPTNRVRFLIKKPAVEQLKACGGTPIFLAQTRLKPVKGAYERRVEQRSSRNGHTFLLTEKSSRTDVERQRLISGERYLEALNNETALAFPTGKNEYAPCPGLIRERYAFAHAGQRCTLDIFPDGKLSEAILEIEQNEESGELKLPEFAEVIRDVTGDPGFSDWELALRPAAS